MEFNRNSILDSSFLFLLVMFEHFIRELVPKELFQFFQENKSAKQMLFFILIYFTLILDSVHDNSIQSNVAMAVVIYIAYLAFSRAHLYVSLITISLLVANLFIDNAIRHYEKEGHQPVRLISLAHYIYYAILGVLFMSSVLYFHENAIKRFNHGNHSNRSNHGNDSVKL